MIDLLAAGHDIVLHLLPADGRSTCRPRRQPSRHPCRAPHRALPGQQLWCHFGIEIEFHHLLQHLLDGRRSRPVEFADGRPSSWLLQCRHRRKRNRSNTRHLKDFIMSSSLSGFVVIFCRSVFPAAFRAPCGQGPWRTKRLRGRRETPGRSSDAEANGSRRGQARRPRSSPRPRPSTATS